MIDTHTHFFELAKTKIAIDLSPAKSLEEVKTILIKFRENMPANLKWVGGSGWNKNIFPSLEGFDKYFLDEVFPDIPVALESKDFHSKWCNSLALAKAGITKDTPNPIGGIIGRFENGEPNGFTHEKAWELIDNVTPAYPLELALKAIKLTIADCYQMGLTGVHVMEAEDRFNYYEQVIASGTKFRFCWHFPNAIIDKMIANNVTSYSGTESLKIGGQKIFTDGALGSQTALMYEAYTGTSNFGRAIYSQDELQALIEKGANHNIASSIHAIGDKACHQVITAIAKCKDIDPTLRHRIEHLQCVRPEDYPAIKDNNIYLALQPIHLRYDIDSIQKYTPNAGKYTYNFKDLLDRDIACGFGSDAPVEIINPFQGIYAAIMRKSMNNPANPSWRPEQKVTTRQALKAYTAWAAIASASEHIRGQIKEGYLADLIVIDDFSQASPEFWLTAKSLLTLIDGQLVYKDEEFTY
jgi:predicted amidohydrolase YtcJ